MPVHNDFEERFVSRLTGLCFIGDPNDFDGWSPSDNGTGNTGGGGHQGNGGNGNNPYGSNSKQDRDRARIRNAGNPGTTPSVGGNDGTGSRTPNSSGAFEDELFEEDRKNHRGSPETLQKEFNDFLRDKALGLWEHMRSQRQDSAMSFSDAIAGNGEMKSNLERAFDELSYFVREYGDGYLIEANHAARQAEYEKIYGRQRMDDAIKKVVLGYIPPPTTPYTPPPTPAPPPPSSASYPIQLPSPTLPSHPNYRTTGYAIDGYDRIFMYGDHTHYTISKLTKVTGYTPPTGKELVKWYGTTYAIPDAAARRRRFG